MPRVEDSDWEMLCAVAGDAAACRFSLDLVPDQRIGRAR
jgi:hypothetical protein